MKKTRNIVLALDTDNVSDAEKIVNEATENGFEGIWKIGPALLYNHNGVMTGYDFAVDLLDREYRVFLDVKLHDIASTVENALRRICDTGFQFVSVHCTKPVLEGVQHLRDYPNTEILGVLNLSSMTREDIVLEAGYQGSPAQRQEIWKRLTERKISQALVSGVNGLVCGAGEVSEIRKISGRCVKTNSINLVCPGIRLKDEDVDNDDQKQKATPKQAWKAGADYIVVGRPYLLAENRKKCLKQLTKGFGK